MNGEDRTSWYWSMHESECKTPNPTSEEKAISCEGKPTNQPACMHLLGGGGLFLADQTKPNQEFVAVGCALGGVAFGWLGVGDVPVDCVLIMCI